MNILTCKICGFSASSLISHIRHKHAMNGTDYKIKFGNVPLSVMSDQQKKKLSDINIKKCKDPAHIKRMSDVQKMGGSIYTKLYWTTRGFSDIEAKKKIKEIQTSNSKKSVAKGNWGKRSWMRVEYWIAKGYTEDMAKKEISKRQAKLSAKSSKFLGHTRTAESCEKISLSMRKKIDEIGTGKWASHFGKFSGRSKAEIKFYNYIKKNIEPTATANEPIGAYIVDVIVNKKIIEFYGDFWHANPMIYKSNEMLAGYMEAPRSVQEIWNNDKKRVDTLRAMGYNVLEIWESDWKKFKNQSINKIKQFLYGNS